MRKKGIISVVLIVCLSALNVTGQEVNERLATAQQLQASFKDQDALQHYLAVLSVAPQNITALCRASELYNVLGKRQSTKDQQKQYYRKAKELAQRALQVNPNSSEANFVMSVAMGRMALIASGEEKIKAVKEIKNYAERSIHLDPKNFKSYHVLGKWYFEVSDLSAIERWLVKVTFGALPAATLEDAIRNYERSHQLNPAFVLNYLELAKAYKRKGENARAITLLQTMQKLPQSSSDDAYIKSEGRKLLENLNK